MKKIIVIILVMISFIGVNAKENDTSVRINWVPNVYYNYERDNITYWGQFGYIYANDELVYCMDLYINITKNTYSSTEDFSLPGVVLSIGYYGYGNENNNKLEDYMATQELLWNYLGYFNIYWTTESGGKGSVIDISEYKNKIRNLASEYAKFPSFISDYKYKVGNIYEIYDEKGIINNNYIIYNSTKNDLSLIEQGIRIVAKEQGKHDFILEKTFERKNSNVLYTSNNSQPLLKIGYLEPISYSFEYDVIGATATFNVVDSETMSTDRLHDTSFENNVFELYDEYDNLIYSTILTDNATFNVDNLNVGNYTLKHVLAVGGYKKSEDIEINIDSDNKTFYIYLEPIYRNLIITSIKGIKKLNYSVPNSNQIFELYKDDILLDTLTTNELGIIKTRIPYGEYVITSDNGYQYKISKNDFVDDITISLNEENYCTKLKVNVYNKETLEKIDSRFIINEKKYNTNNGSFVTEEICEGVYDILEDVDDENKIKEQITIDSTTKYILDNNQVYTEINLYKEIPILEIKELPNLGITNV